MGQAHSRLLGLRIPLGLIPCKMSLIWCKIQQSEQRTSRYWQLAMGEGGISCMVFQKSVVENRLTIIKKFADCLGETKLK